MKVSLCPSKDDIYADKILFNYIIAGFSKLIVASFDLIRNDGIAASTMASFTNVLAGFISGK